LPSLAAVRQIEPRKLTALLRGELDWVVMKCLEKQRDRRYESASALARDLQRYLSNEPVEARPASAVYRVSKFVRRHRTAVTAAAAVLLALVGLAESLKICVQKTPDDWKTFNTKSRLGGAFLGQKKYVEAEVYLKDGYEGMKQRSASIPTDAKNMLAEAVDRLIQLNSETNKTDEAKKWQAEKDKLVAAEAKRIETSKARQEKKP
jgi:hypothetical protein